MKAPLLPLPPSTENVRHRPRRRRRIHLRRFLTFDCTSEAIYLCNYNNMLTTARLRFCRRCPAAVAALVIASLAHSGLQAEQHSVRQGDLGTVFGWVD